MHNSFTRAIAYCALGLMIFFVSSVDAQTLTGVVSRKIHGVAGMFGLPIATGIPITGAVTVEPRVIGAGHQLVFQFNNSVNAVAASSATIGTATHAINGNDVVVTLTGVPDNQRVTVTLMGVDVTGVVGNLVPDPQVSVGFLVGDVDGNLSVETTDLKQVKSRSGFAPGSTDFRFDAGISGSINASDISAVKSRVGQTLATAQQAKLTLNVAGAGGGTLSGSGTRFSKSATISCPAVAPGVCSSSFAYFDTTPPNNIVTLLAIADSGSCATGWSGGCTSATASTNISLSNDSICTATFATNFAVSPSAGANGSIAPAIAQGACPGTTATFTIAPNAGFTASVSGSCGGSLVGNLYTTNAISMPCTVVANFVANTYAVTPSAGANGAISPATVQNVTPGATTSFTVTANSGFAALVSGSCGGSLIGNIFTTNPVSMSCTVVANFVPRFAVTPSAGSNGVINPSSQQLVAQGATTVFTVSPNANYTPSVGGTCGGSLVGLTFTTNPVVAACTVSATFTRTSFTVTPSAGNNGTISPTSPQAVLNGATRNFTISAAAGYAAVVGGTCGGAFTSATNYRTSPITGNCSVVASFASTSPKYVATNGNDTTGSGSIGNPWKTIVKGISSLVGGETLIVRNGVYSGPENFIAELPSGISTKFTTIVAESPMQVRIQSLTSLGIMDNQLNLSGNYIKVDGFIFDMQSSINPAFIGSISGNFNTVSRSIFKRGGDIDAFGGLLEVTGSDNLFEDISGAGACSICFKQGGATETTQRNIWRRVIGRFDYSNSTQPKATFATIGGTTPGNVRDHLYQNVIALDGQNPGGLGGAEKIGAFYAAQNTANISLQGSMVLNEGVSNSGMFLRELGSINNASHSVVWDLRNTLAGATGIVGGNADRLTIGGNIPGAAVDLITSATTSLLKPAINPASLLNNTPGAVMLKQYGTSGTRWGQTGYDQITTVDLWPWPYQDIIRSVFREPNNGPPGNSPAINNTLRGFSADGIALYGGPITLSSYIWEYLGTACPPTVCTIYSVTPSAGPNGTISPSTVQSIPPGATATFTVVPNSGLAATVGGTCGGILSGTTYTTNAINGSCTVAATFSVPNTAVLSWDPVVDANLVGYRVYFGTASGVYSQTVGSGINAGNVTTYSLTGLTSGTRYYFVVTAFDNTGRESGYSNEVFKDVP